MSREEIQRRLEQWLDCALASEDPPTGVAAEILAAVTGASQGPPRQAPATTYSLWAAMTALTQEVKLQGRSFKELSDTLGTEASRGAERQRETAERERNLARETERRCRKEILGVLIDLRDRLARGLESVRASEAGIATAASATRRGWRARLFARPSADPSGDTLAALKKGYELGLDRLDQTLDEFNARAIPCEGLAFDPRRMNAVDRQESTAVPEGTVIEVYRNGYEWNGEVFRPAQVKVACAPAGKEHE
ncbi:MAG TPA: nucleotide exchange factor GrpE [Bryobacteraceae bacterium]|nr:nucleotide exchange factor GrpE [Bryobacteraceae bacterium]